MFQTAREMNYPSVDAIIHVCDQKAKFQCTRKSNSGLTENNTLSESFYSRIDRNISSSEKIYLVYIELSVCKNLRSSTNTNLYQAIEKTLSQYHRKVHAIEEVRCPLGKSESRVIETRSLIFGLEVHLLYLCKSLRRILKSPIQNDIQGIFALCNHGTVELKFNNTQIQ